MIRMLVALGIVCMLSLNAWGGERRKLTAEEVKESSSQLRIWAGFMPAYGLSWLLVSRPDGTREVYWHDGKQVGGGVGTYRGDGDKLCMTWNHKGYEECYEFYQIGENQFEGVIGGQVESIYYRLR